MNFLSSEYKTRANEEAIYNIYAYLTPMTTPYENESLKSIALRLEENLKKHIPKKWKDNDIHRLNTLKNALRNNPQLGDSKIGNLTQSESGLTAFSIEKPDGSISVIFKGTGEGEWIDNGEGLSGIPEENTYIAYEKNSTAKHIKYVKEDFATDQQVEALNWFNYVCSKNSWNEDTKITVSGHSKGGNKAQFITIHSNLVHRCYSFNGQGFSPEALNSFKKQYKENYLKRRQKILCFSSENDYVNVLGKRLALIRHIYYFKSFPGLHNIQSMLDFNGKFHSQCEQGKLSKYIETASDRIMSLDASKRQYATLGIMNIFQKYLGEGTPVNGDYVSMEKTAVGLTIAIKYLLKNII